MTHCDLDKVNSGSATGRAEVMAAIEGLVEEVAHLALRVKRIVSIADARRTRSESRKRAALRRRARRRTLEQAELRAMSAATVSDVQAVEMAEAPNFPQSSQQDSCTDNASRGETDMAGEPTAKLEAAFPQPQGTNCPEVNAIAARVAELHDRLGGFIKPSVPQQPDRTT